MELTLRYRGGLPAVQTDNRTKEKQEIRQVFSAQLRDFWGRDPRFNHVKLETLHAAERSEGRFQVLRPHPNMSKVLYHYPLGGFFFIPIVTSAREADCSLSIRLHRPQSNGNIVFDGGDLDNRLKTLFDALRMPHEMSQLGGCSPEPGTDGRIVCLLEDDRLITKLAIESKRMLAPPTNDPNYVELDIDVILTAVNPLGGNVPFLFR